MPDGFCCNRRDFWPAAIEVTVANVIPWVWNGPIYGRAFADISLETWKSNIEQGFQWDGNSTVFF